MKFVFRGKFISLDQLPKADLPYNAIKFIEPDSPEKVKRAAFAYSMLSLIPIVLIIIASLYFHGASFSINPTQSYFLAVILPFLFVIPHELLLGLCFGEGAEVEMYYSNRMWFVVCTKPISKARFIWVCLCPNLIIGWLPLIVWAVFPWIPFGNTLLIFSVLSITLGGADYMNAWNALRQMPKGSIHQLSGFQSYWYIPTVETKDIGSSDLEIEI